MTTMGPIEPPEGVTWPEVKWVIMASEDGCEWMLTAEENIERCPKLTFDTEGEPMKVVKRFSGVATYEEAKAISEAEWDAYRSD